MSIKAKYFSSSTYEGACEKGLAYFECEKKHFFPKTVFEGNQIEPWLVLGLYSLLGELSINNMNGFFQLFFEGDGVYLEIMPKQGNGVAQNQEKMTQYIFRKELVNLDIEAIKGLLEAGGVGRVKIASPQAEKLLAEFPEITVSQNGMEAVLKLLPPDPGGPSLERVALDEELSKAGVIFGVDEAEIERAFKEKSYQQTYIIAKGLEPENGVDGYLEFHFQQERSLAPKVDEKDKVNFKELDLFETVKSGQLLVTRYLASDGQPGSSVTGTVLKQKPGKEAKLPKGKNVTINEDSTAIYSNFNGMVDFINGTVNVSNIYNINADADMKVGNVEFDGSIMVKGNVISGLVLKASGNIVVGGVVEGAHLIAGGNVELKRGIQGNDKGRIEAAGSVISTYIERATIIAGQDIRADVIIHSELEAGGYLYVRGKRGNITGGRALIAKEVIANFIGSTSHTQTTIEVGVLPSTLTRIKFINEEIKRIGKELDKLNTLETYLSKGQTTEDPKKADTLNSVILSKKNNTQLLEQYADELNILNDEVENSTEGKIHVFNKVHPGVKISIATANYRIDDDSIPYVTFKFRNGKIEFCPCEAKK